MRVTPLVGLALVALVLPPGVAAAGEPAPPAAAPNVTDGTTPTLAAAGDGTVVGHRRRTAVDVASPAVDGDADPEEDRDDDPDGGGRPLADPPAAGASADDRVERASEDPDVTESPTDGATA